MEESKKKQNENHKFKKARTHIPVEGFKIEQLRELPLEELLKLQMT